MNEIVTQDDVNGPAKLDDLQRRLVDLKRQIAASTDCAKVVGLMAIADSLEENMANAGYRGNTEALRPANEVRFEARWKLGQLLAKMEKQQGSRTDLTLSRAGTKSGFRAYLEQIGLIEALAGERDGE